MTTTLTIDSRTVGRIAERIVANELEARGFRVTDLNKDGVSANADLLAAGHNTVWQIQVKGATNSPKDKHWWIQYGYCTAEIIKKAAPMFNRRQSFYEADIVVLIAVRSPTEYRCVVLRAEEAERAAQLNLDRQYRTPTREGAEKKPHKVWLPLEPAPKEDQSAHKDWLAAERQIIKHGDGAWDILVATS